MPRLYYHSLSWYHWLFRQASVAADRSCLCRSNAPVTVAESNPIDLNSLKFLQYFFTYILPRSKMQSNAKQCGWVGLEGGVSTHLEQDQPHRWQMQTQTDWSGQYEGKGARRTEKKHRAEKFDNHRGVQADFNSYGILIISAHWPRAEAMSQHPLVVYHQTRCTEKHSCKISVWLQHQLLVSSIRTVLQGFFIMYVCRIGTSCMVWCYNVWKKSNAAHSVSVRLGARKSCESKRGFLPGIVCSRKVFPDAFKWVGTGYLHKDKTLELRSWYKTF